MAESYTYRIPENAAFPWTITNTEGASTDGQTVSMYAVDITDGTTTLLGTGSGAAIGSDITINVDFSGVDAGKTYEIQAAANVGGANPVVVVPNTKTANHVYAYVYNMAIY